MILKDLLRYFPSKILPALLGLLSIPIYTRLLDVDDYGTYLLLMNVLAILSAFFFSWLSSISLRFYEVNGFIDLHKFCKTYLIYSWVLASCFWIVIYQLQLKEIFPNMMSVAVIVIGILWLYLNANFEYLLNWLRPLDQAGKYALFISSKAFGTLLLSIVLITELKFGGLSILISSLLVSLTFIFLMLGFFRNFSTNSVKAFEGMNKNYLLTFGFTAAFVNLITISMSYGDRFFVQYFLGVDSVAVYGANYDLAEKGVIFLNSVFILSSSASAIRLFENDGETKCINYLSDVLFYYLAFSVPIISFVFLYAADFIKIILPETYWSGAGVILYISISGVILGILHRFSLILTIHKRIDLNLTAGILAIILNFILCFFLIPRFGILGAAYATVLTYLFYLAATVFFAKKFMLPSISQKQIFSIILPNTLVVLLMSYLKPYVGLLASITLFSILVLIILFGLNMVYKLKFKLYDS